MRQAEVFANTPATINCNNLDYSNLTDYKKMCKNQLLLFYFNFHYSLQSQCMKVFYLSDGLFWVTISEISFKIGGTASLKSSMASFSTFTHILFFLITKHKQQHLRRIKFVDVITLTAYP